MQRNVLLILAASTLAVRAFAAEPFQPTSNPEVVTIHCGHFFDATTGKLLGETTIVTEGKRIKDVKAGTQPGAGVRKPSSSALQRACPA